MTPANLPVGIEPPSGFLLDPALIDALCAETEPAEKLKRLKQLRLQAEKGRVGEGAGRQPRPDLYRDRAERCLRRARHPTGTDRARKTVLRRGEANARDRGASTEACRARRAARPGNATLSGKRRHRGRLAGAIRQFVPQAAQIGCRTP